MTEETTREMLETLASAQDEQSQDTATTTPEQQTTTTEPDEWSTAPNAYRQEYKDSFNTLSPEWRKYLIERESEAQKGISRLQNEAQQRKWIDDIVATRKDILAQSGLSAPEYFNRLVNIVDTIDNDPRSGLMQLAQHYGVDLSNSGEPTEKPAWVQQIQAMNDRISKMQQYIQQAEKSKANNELETFATAKDEAGNLMYKHFDNQDVKFQMGQLLSSGLAKDLKSAYDMAVWNVSGVRDQLIKEHSEREMATKAAEAEKAKAASFAPKGKQAAPASVNNNKSTIDLIREEAERLGIS